MKKQRDKSANITQRRNTSIEDNSDDISPKQIESIDDTHVDISNAKNTSIKVVCRFRPLNEKELEIEKEKESTNEETQLINYVSNSQLQFTSLSESQTYNFNFDNIFPPNTTQSEIYDSSAKEIISSVLNGYNGTIFAYGQTSSGKTYTMTGELDNAEKEGIIPRMIHHVFHEILCSDNSNIEYTVKVSIVEIYMEKIKDLIDISKNNLQIHESKEKGVYIDNLSEYYVSNEAEVYDYIKIGNQNRTVSSTNMNDTSSRSHSIVIMSIIQRNIKDNAIKTGKLYLVDLAGSEKLTKTGAEGITLEEAKMINKSLSALGMVINSLTDGKSTHIPYRNSKLTRILSESLGGNAKTCLIITCSPSSFNEAETLSTLRFGERAKKIKNKPKINKIETVGELKGQIEKLNKQILNLQKIIEQKGIDVKSSNDLEDKVLITKDEYQTMENRIGELEFLNDELEKRVIELRNQIEQKNISSIKENPKEDTIQIKHNEQIKIESLVNISLIGKQREHDDKDIEEIAQKEMKKYENEKKIILKTISDQKNNILTLNSNINDLKEKIKIYEMNINPKDKTTSDKILQLEKSCELYNNLYQQATAEKSSLKIENTLLEMKYQRRNEKVSLLQRELNDLKKQLHDKDMEINCLSRAPISSKIVKVVNQKQYITYSNVLLEQNNYNTNK